MKFDIRKKVVSAAVASAVVGAAVISMPAEAVNISQNNLGQVLLFPMYTVKNGYDTIFTLTNTSANTVVAKIRWREALNSREVLDFNVVLSPYDMWTGAVTADAAGTGALVRTFDKTCTSPKLPVNSALGSADVPFSSIAFDGTDAGYKNDKASTSISRVQEGYFEVFNMGEFPAGSEDKVPVAALHSGGVPKDCTTVGNSVAADYDTATTDFMAPSNSLKGAVSYIAVATGKAIDATPTAIEGFVSDTIWAAPGDVGPDLNNGDIGMTANALNDGNTYSSGAIAQSVDAVTTLLMADEVINEFSASVPDTGTDWVVTFPTKHHYTDGREFYPFGMDFTAAGKSSNTITPTLWNREEGTTTPDGNTVSPRPAGSELKLHYEMNIITFNGSNVFGTGTSHQSIDTTAVGKAGWMRLGLVGYKGTGGVTGVGGDVSSTPTVTGMPGQNGLPVIGFAAIDRNNASAAGNNRNYGSSVAHAYKRK